MKFFIALNWFFDFLHFSAGSNGRYVFIVFISIVSAIVILIVYKLISNQNKIRFHKDKIFGNLLQMALYKDKLNLLFLSVLNIIKHNILYIMQSLVPFFVICIPIIILTIQVNNRCGYQPFKINQSFIIRADMKLNSGNVNVPSVIEQINCSTSPDIIIETPPLRLETEGAVFWRAKVIDLTHDKSSCIRIGFQGDKDFIEKTVVTDYCHKRFSPVKAKWSFLKGLFDNAEGFLSDDALFGTVSIDYKRASYVFFLWRVDAIIFYVILTLIFVFVFKGFFRVRI